MCVCVEDIGCTMIRCTFNVFLLVRSITRLSGQLQLAYSYEPSTKTRCYWDWNMREFGLKKRFAKRTNNLRD